MFVCACAEHAADCEDSMLMYIATLQLQPVGFTGSQQEEAGC